MNIVEYTERWDKSEEKEKNNPDFMASVIEYLSNPERFWAFDNGENGYCGYTCQVFDSFDPWFKSARFEFAYGADFVKMFTANHNGFLVPEYIDVTGFDAEMFLGVLRAACLRTKGFIQTT